MLLHSQELGVDTRGHVINRSRCTSIQSDVLCAPFLSRLYEYLKVGSAVPPTAEVLRGGGVHGFSDLPRARAPLCGHGLP